MSLQVEPPQKVVHLRQKKSQDPHAHPGPGPGNGRAPRIRVRKSSGAWDTMITWGFLPIFLLGTWFFLWGRGLWGLGHVGHEHLKSDNSSLHHVYPRFISLKWWFTNGQAIFFSGWQHGMSPTRLGNPKIRPANAIISRALLFIFFFGSVEPAFFQVPRFCAWGHILYQQDCSTVEPKSFSPPAR